MMLRLIRVLIFTQLWVTYQALEEFWSGSQEVCSLPPARDKFAHYLNCFDYSINKDSERMLFVFDHDDTLTSNGARGEDPELKIRLLKVLTANPKHDVWIITGRRLGDVREIYADVKGLNFAGEHGQVFLRAGGTNVEQRHEQEALELKKDVKDFVTRAGLTSHIDYKDVASFAVFTCPDNSEMRSFIEKLKLHVERENENIRLKSFPNPENRAELVVSIRDRTVNKGQLVERLLGQKYYGAVLIAGDHRIDEEMFDVAKRFQSKRGRAYFTILVGDGVQKQTHAIHKVKDPEDLLLFLQEFLFAKGMLKNPNKIDGHFVCSTSGRFILKPRL